MPKLFQMKFTLEELYLLTEALEVFESTLTEEQHSTETIDQVAALLGRVDEKKCRASGEPEEGY